MNKFIDLFTGDNYISLKEMDTITNNYHTKYIKIKKNIFYYLYPTKRKFMKYYKNINNLTIKNNNIYLNNEYLRQKEILDNIKGYKLDQEQVKCVISDEEASLIVAGAGSGKSLTIIGKIRYLIEAKYIEENEILCISKTKKRIKNIL